MTQSLVYQKNVFETDLFKFFWYDEMKGQLGNIFKISQDCYVIISLRKVNLLFVSLFQILIDHSSGKKD